MKLLYQLNAAFTVLLLVIMSITAFFIYSLLMDMLVQDEQRQLQAKGELLIDVLNEENESIKASQLSQLVQDDDFRILLLDQTQGEPVYSTLPAETSADWAARYNQELHEQDLWESANESFVVYDLPITPRESGLVLVMATPLNDLQAVQSVFATRMIAVLLIGLVLAVTLSYFLTRRLVTPLTRLKQELKKIEKRQFEAIEPIKASGEIKEVEQSVRHTAAELERYILSQKQFFQNASHELKTPLMSIQGYAEGIRDGIFQGDEADRGLNVMVSETERLKKIVNEMILLAKLESNEDIYHPGEADVVNLLIQAKDRLYPLASEQEVDIRVEETGSFITYVDEEKILQALINIIGNAIRHADAVITIEKEVQDQNITIKIVDDGDGIPDELLPHLFERFIKGKEGETGLGLAISRAIIERSGGKIHAYNNPVQEGAVFVITLPKQADDKLKERDHHES
ncbi:cell wall metabolism sensor histidine kinase WalK [Thalassobacillus sp. CUG 92003]|uniref:sensor histidine kinase n=1 Tax=Thalassobacillus sp. CUG 92003 TaxID=2736641 RepID=UPI0015E6997C|nr:HAMP domain-containing sensor histidine kinase [Thalassobacillus sp. CUG 92003]